MTRTLIVIENEAFGQTGEVWDKAEYWYGNGKNRIGQDFIDELKPQIGEPIERVQKMLKDAGYVTDHWGAHSKIADAILWLESIHIIRVEKGRVDGIETWRKHGDE